MGPMEIKYVKIEVFRNTDDNPDNDRSLHMAVALAHDGWRAAMTDHFEDGNKMTAESHSRELRAALLLHGDDTLEEFVRLLEPIVAELSSALTVASARIGTIEVH